MVFIYNGPSMRPTFRIGQMLYVKPVVLNPAPGDVVVFADPARNEHIVHRVVAVTPEGLTTRGDHNLQCDELPVAFGQIVGLVEAADFGGKIRSVAGGKRGLRNAKIRWHVLGLWARLRLIAARPYHAAVQSPALRGWAKRLINLQFEYITLQTSQGPVIKALHHGRVVARWKPGMAYFRCRVPYALWLQPDDHTSRQPGPQSAKEK